MHVPDIIGDTRIGAVIIECLGGQYQVDAQAPFGITLKTPTAVIKPAETIVHQRMAGTIGIDEPPCLQFFESLTLLG